MKSLGATIVPVVLGGELAVPCTRNPLQRGRSPSRGPARWLLSLGRGVDGRVLCDGAT